MAAVVVNDVVTEDNLAGIWCVLADETTDRAKTEQIAMLFGMYRSQNPTHL